MNNTHPPTDGYKAQDQFADGTIAVARVAAPPKHLHAVDGLRGFAALLIVVYHLFDQAGSPEYRILHHVNILRPLHDGWCGVNLFLILSGFCLFWPYARYPQRRFQMADFMKRRCLRILPAYYVSLAVIPLISWLLYHDARLVTNYHGLTDLALHLTLLHSLNADTVLSYCAVYWSLGLEWTWYLFFPAALWLFRRFGATRALLTLGAATLAYSLGLYLHFGPVARMSAAQVHLVPATRLFLAARLYEFGLGMYAAWWLANREITHRCVTCCLVFCPLLLVAGHIATPVDPQLPIRNILYGTAFALLLLAVIAPVSNAAQRVFASKLLCSIGEYSYSLYLFHMVIAYPVGLFLKQHGHQNALTFFGILLLIPPILLVSKLAYLLFERPFIRSREAAFSKQHKPTQSAVESIA